MRFLKLIPLGFFCFTSFQVYSSSELEKDSTFCFVDIGSGSTKLLCSDGRAHEFPMKYQASMTQCGNIPFHMVEEGGELLNPLISSKERSGSCGAATAVFRTAFNGDSALQQLELAAGVKIHLISQQLEAQLAYEAAQDVGKSRPVFDIGGGSFQVVAADAQEKLFHDGGHVASSDFFIAVLRDVKKDPSLKTPNPFTADEVEGMIALVPQMFPSLSAEMSQAVLDANKTVVGVGSVHRVASHLIRSVLQEENQERYWLSYSREDIWKTIQFLSRKTDEQIATYSKGHKDYLSHEVTNLALIYGLMTLWNIDTIKPKNISIADPILKHGCAWFENLVKADQKNMLSEINNVEE